MMILIMISLMVIIPLFIISIVYYRKLSERIHALEISIEASLSSNLRSQLRSMPLLVSISFEETLRLKSAERKQ